MKKSSTILTSVLDVEGGGVSGYPRFGNECTLSHYHFEANSGKVTTLATEVRRIKLL